MVYVDSLGSANSLIAAIFGAVLGDRSAEGGKLVENSARVEAVRNLGEGSLGLELGQCTLALGTLEALTILADTQVEVAGID